MSQKQSGHSTKAGVTSLDSAVGPPQKLEPHGIATETALPHSPTLHDDRWHELSASRPPVDPEPTLGIEAQKRIFGPLAGKRVLLIAAGGGGDIAGTLPTGWMLKEQGADVILAGLSLKRTSHDAGSCGFARNIAEYAKIQKINEFIGLVDGATHVDPKQYFKTPYGVENRNPLISKINHEHYKNHQGKTICYPIEADVSLSLEGQFQVGLIDPSPGIKVMRQALEDFASQMGIDSVIVIDMGGDILCGDAPLNICDKPINNILMTPPKRPSEMKRIIRIEPTSSSPLCDQFSLGAASTFKDSMTIVAGMGGDGEFPRANLAYRLDRIRQRAGYIGGCATPLNVLGRWGMFLENAQTESSKTPLRVCQRNLDRLTGDYNHDMYRAQAILDQLAESDVPTDLINEITSVDQENLPLRRGTRTGELSLISAFNLALSSEVVYRTNQFSELFDENDSFLECAKKLEEIGVDHELVDTI